MTTPKTPSSSTATSATSSTTSKKPDSPDLQGEGNYDAARRYDKSAREFAQSGQVEPAARAAQPRDEREAEELRRAEREGRSHAHGDANDTMDAEPKKTPRP